MIIITGASGKLGTLIVKNLLKERKEKIICISRSFPENYPQNKRILKVKLDITNFSKLHKAINNIIKDNNITILINCAGICKSKQFLERDYFDIIKQVETNLTSYIAMTKLVLPNMNNGSHIINVSSLMVKIPSKYYTVYSATKFGIVGFSESLRMELENSGILVSTILPSLFMSKMTENAIVPKIIKPVSAEIISNKISRLIGKHEGLKTIGIQSALSCIVERILPQINRNISKNLL